MSGMGVEPWETEEWEAFEKVIEAQGLMVIHCAHCDRSDRHPSCLIVEARATATEGE